MSETIDILSTYRFSEVYITLVVASIQVVEIKRSERRSLGLISLAFKVSSI